MRERLDLLNKLREAAENAMKAKDIAYREDLAAFMLRNGFATGHGETFDDLLTELEWQVRERGVPFLRAALQEIEAKTLEYTYPGREAINAIASRALSPRSEGD